MANLQTDFDPEVPPIPCLPGGLSQVLLNLIVNAAHSISDKGREGDEKGVITIITRRVEGMAEIRISDTGMGIPEEVRPKIFDPFFTTKGIGEGTGQGLTLSHGIIVKEHGGTLHFETEVGAGTTFVIRLPLEGKPEELPTPA